MKRDQGRLVIYSRRFKYINSILQEIHEDKIDITVESCEKCLTNLESCMLDTLQKDNPNLILIENDNSNDGLMLYKMIKDEGTLEDIPILFLGGENKEAKMSALKLGALDYMNEPYDREELITKIKNYIELDQKYIIHDVYDRMTGVYSRSYGEEAVKKEFEISRIQKYTLSVLAADIDNMSNINHLIGKKSGDSVIRDCVSIFIKVLGPRDFIYRYSGSKFIIIFSDKAVNEVVEACKGIIREVFKLSDKYEAEVSCTIGISNTGGKAESYYELFDKAIQCLENGKLKEKSRVYLNEYEAVSKERSSLLIINEDKVISGILSSRYNNKGFQTYVAEDIEAAEEIIKQHKIDLVLTDYIIPGATGTDAIRRLKNIEKSLKIIILSAQKNEYVIETALGAGAEDYVVKPFSPVELDSRIKRLLE